MPIDARRMAERHGRFLPIPADFCCVLPRRNQRRRRNARPVQASDHSILAPEMAISSAHFLISEWMKAAKASGELAMLSMPWDSNLARMSSDWLILFTRALKRWTIAAGVPAGATSPYQARTSNPG